MKKISTTLFLFLFALLSFANEITISSPNKKLVVDLNLNQGGELSYNVLYDGKVYLNNSPLGMITNESDFSRGLTFLSKQVAAIDEEYQVKLTKKKDIHYTANEVICNFENAKKEKISIVFRVSDNDIAFKYTLAQNGETARCTIEKELTGFRFPENTTTFLTPQATPMIGWMKTKPSYEEEYVADEAMGTPSKYGVGYTFPGLFHVGENGWVLVSETGVSSLYCGSKLSEGTSDGLYSIAFPEPGENNGVGSHLPSISLPGETPWRTITVGDSLEPIVETTVAFDVVEPLFTASQDYKMDKSTWSWLMWQDNSVCFDDQIKFIDLASEMGYPYNLVDGLWDKNIGKEKIEELSRYAQSKNVNLCLWYNSNGYSNDAPQGPKNRMNTSVARKKEMAWMKSIGVKGIKVDFFGGDKQETMKLYEDIISDANDYGLFVIFHGCTLPRGWERMYPNFAGSEAVLASENLIFTQHANDTEAYNATLHPFIRNSVASMEFGPVLLNKKHNRENNGGPTRKTTDIFQLATAVIFQSPVQNFGITPNNLIECKDFVIDFMRDVPTLWDDIDLIDGYPGKYVVLARKNNNKWYVAGMNAEKKEKKLTLDLPMFANQTVVYYFDDKKREPQMKELKVGKDGKATVVIQPEGGIILTNK